MSDYLPPSASVHSRGNQLLSLPCAVLSTHILRGGASPLCTVDLKAFRSVSRGARDAVNADVEQLRLTGADLQRPGRSTPNLERLATSFPNLKHLILSDTPRGRVCGSAVDALLAPMSSPCSSPSPHLTALRERLTSLDLKHCHFLSSQDLSLLLIAFPKLTHLAMPRWTDASHLRALSAATPSLTHLDLGDPAVDVTTITDATLSYIPHLPYVTSLSLQRCVGVTDAGVASLAGRLPALAHLDLSATRVSGRAGFESLGPQLRGLVLRGCRAVGAAGLGAVCAAAVGLTSLRLCGTAAMPGGAAMRAIAQATSLESLDLGPTWELDDEGLAALTACPRLRELRIGNVALAARPPPSALRALRRLALGGMFAQAGLARLLPLPGLARLELAGLATACDGVLATVARRQAGLQELQLSAAGPDLTPAGLQALSRLPALARLQLSGCPGATEAAVRQLVATVRDEQGRRLVVEVAQAVKKTAAPQAAVQAAGDGGYGVAAVAAEGVEMEVGARVVCA